jgi:hypothetical protein
MLNISQRNKEEWMTIDFKAIGLLTVLLKETLKAAPVGKRDERTLAVRCLSTMNLLANELGIETANRPVELSRVREIESGQRAASQALIETAELLIERWKDAGQGASNLAGLLKKDRVPLSRDGLLREYQENPNVSHLARLFGWDRHTIRRKLREYGIVAE